MMGDRSTTAVMITTRDLNHCRGERRRSGGQRRRRSQVLGRRCAALILTLIRMLATETNVLPLTAARARCGRLDTAAETNARGGNIRAASHRAARSRSVRSKRRVIGAGKQSSAAVVMVAAAATATATAIATVP